MSITIGNHSFHTKANVYIMGILNITPDSFSDGGHYNTLDRAFRQTEKMIQDGAHIIDVGGESTRPGHTVISYQEEIDRVSPVIEGIHARFDIPISIDTYKSQVAEEAIRVGANMVNDIWGLQYDPLMATVIAKSHVACCLTHNRKNPEYSNFMAEVLEDLKKSIDIAKNACIPSNKIILDPGVGFGKTYEQNLEVMGKLEHLHTLGYPVLLGASRKSVIEKTLALPVEQRLEGTLATTVMAVTKGVSFVRVHDVLENKRAIDMAQAIIHFS